MSDTHVNIKMFTEKQDDLEYNCNVLVYDNAGIKDPYFIQMTREKEPNPMYVFFYHIFIG